MLEKTAALRPDTPRTPLSQMPGFIPLRLGETLTAAQLDALFPRERVAPLMARLRARVSEVSK